MYYVGQELKNKYNEVFTVVHIEEDFGTNWITVKRLSDGYTYQGTEKSVKAIFSEQDNMKEITVRYPSHLQVTLTRKQLGLTPRQALINMLKDAFRMNYEELQNNGSYFVIANNAVAELRKHASNSNWLFSETVTSIGMEKFLTEDGKYIVAVIDTFRLARPSQVDKMLREAKKLIG
jgi:hypothetical protein